MEEKSQVALFNEEIKRELKDPAVMRALIATTFKKLKPEQVQQAILEGMIRGFTFKQFMEKDVYALPYGQGYSLVTSIDLARKRGARSGVNGKSEPTFVMTPEKKLGDKDYVTSCSVTIHKKGGHPDGYTATVYFEEYYKEGKTWDGKYTPSMWDTKPRTMIAKVAEMHALRMACPEELSQIYVEEEFHNSETREGRMGEAKALVEASGLKVGELSPNGKKEEKGGEADDHQVDAAQGTIL